MRGEFKNKLEVSDYINTQVSEPENIYSYMDMKIQNLHEYLSVDYVSKLQNLMKIETSKLGEEVASDINVIERQLNDHKTELEIFQDSTKKAMFSLEAMLE